MASGNSKMVSDDHQKNITIDIPHQGGLDSIDLRFPSGKRILSNGEDGSRFFATTLSAFLREFGSNHDHLQETLNQVVQLATTIFPGLNLSNEKAGLLSAIGEQLTLESTAPLVPGRPGQYQKLSNEPPDTTEQIVTIQVIRQAKYSEWLSLPFPAGDMPEIPSDLFGASLPFDRLEEALGWGIPLIGEMSKDSAARTDFKKDWYTDLDMAHLYQQSVPANLTTVYTLHDLKTNNTLPRIKSPMSLLSSAWGILLETVFVARYLKSIRDGKASSEGTWLKARADSWALGLIREVEAWKGDARVLGFGTGRIHLTVSRTDEASLKDLSDIAINHSAYAYTQDGVIHVPPDFKAVGTENVFVSLLQERNAEKLIIADKEIQNILTNTIS